MKATRERPEWWRFVGEWHLGIHFLGAAVAVACFRYWWAALFLVLVAWLAALIGDALLNRRALKARGAKPPLLVDMGSRFLDWLLDRRPETR